MFNECLDIRWKTAQFCILNFSFKNDFVWEEISNIRHSVSSPDETPRSSSKILRCASYFQLSSRCFIWWWNTASHVWYITLNPKIKIWILICCPLFISCSSSGEKLIKYQANSYCVIMSVILMTTLFYKALILPGENWCWSLSWLKGLSSLILGRRPRQQEPKM